MSDMSSQLQDLLVAARRACPSAQEHEAIRAKVLRQVGVPRSGALRRSLVRWGGFVCGAAAVIGVALLLSEGRPSADARSEAALAPAPVLAPGTGEPAAPRPEPAPEVEVQVPAVTWPPPPTVPVRPLRAAPTIRRSPREQSNGGGAARDDSLSAELDLLTRASKELAGGRPNEALVRAMAHQEHFAHGMLVEERETIRILALCALDRRSEGTEALSRFARTWPQSAQLERLRAACSPR